jgi:hypothetical protein
VLPDFKIYDESIVIDTVWFLYKNKHVDQRNGELRIKSCIQDKLICDKNANTHNGEWTVSSTNDVGKTGYSLQKMKFDPYTMHNNQIKMD